MWPVLLAQVLPRPQLIFPSKTWFLGIYLNFQQQKSFNIQELLHRKSKHHGTKAHTPLPLSRAFERHQEHDLKHPGLVDLRTSKQNKLPSFIDRCVWVCACILYAPSDIQTSQQGKQIILQILCSYERKLPALVAACMKIVSWKDWQVVWTAHTCPMEHHQLIETWQTREASAHCHLTWPPPRILQLPNLPNTYIYVQPPKWHT